MNRGDHISEEIGGDEGARTPDLYAASVALSQLSYGPVIIRINYLTAQQMKFKSLVAHA